MQSGAKSDLLAGLNASQRQAVCAVAGPILIVAGAGTGKTRTLTHRLAYLVTEAGLAARQLLAITFTTKAAEEMRTRIAGLGRDLGDMWIGTIHALCHEILRNHGAEIGLPPDFEIITQADRAALIKHLVHEQAGQLTAGLLRQYDLLISKEKNVVESYDSLSPLCRAYQEKLLAAGQLDFDDLILKTIDLFRRAPATLARQRERFSHLCIDEFQDISPDLELFEKLALLFDRFETVNGQRNRWQNLLVWQWLNDLTEEKIEGWSRKHGINPSDFCRHPYRKICTGGSDDHNGIFAGTCGTWLHVPDLKQRLGRQKPSEIALDALRNGPAVPFGYVGDDEKLNISLLDFLSQMTLNLDEPGLLRMFLHQGTLSDKFFCLGITNVVQELKRHKFTVYFFRTLHDALQGKRPGFFGRFRASTDFKPILLKIDSIARNYHRNHKAYLDTLGEAVPEIFGTLFKTIVKRIRNNSDVNRAFDAHCELNTRSLIEQFEIPTHFRALFEEEHYHQMGGQVTQVNMSRFFDQLSFPVLASSIMAGSSLISSRSLNSNRRFLQEFADSLGNYQYPERVLWLTDTLRDKNGVSSSLSAKLKVIQEHNLPIDFLVCDNDIIAEPHLKVVPSIGRFTFPNYREQTIDIPNILEVKQLFMEGGYDRIVCSTEFVMGLVGLFLKESFKVPAYFFLHTDWLEFIRDTTQLEQSTIDRIRRILRFFYRRYDGIFVLNKDDRDWLVSDEIGMDAGQVHLTAHWAAEAFYPRLRQLELAFDNRIGKEDFVLLYAGRISEEKGVMELPVVYGKLKQSNPSARLVIAGVGPAEEKLRQQVPDAVFLGWVDREMMPILYSSAHMLVLPSRFDTFGNVILEAISCGLPVAAYRIKGPREIIEDTGCGILAETLHELAEGIAETAVNPERMEEMRTQALRRSRAFTIERTMTNFMKNIGLSKSFLDTVKSKAVTRSGSLPGLDSLKKAV